MGKLEIKELYLGHFGKFEKKEIRFNHGINVIQGANEAGKSTIHSFIRGMFFGIEKKRGREAKGDLYAKYQPWETPGAYHGSMIVEKNDKVYQITRNFLQKERSVSITDMTTGREITERKLAEQSVLEHFNETVYRNTISIEQLKAATEKEFAAELQNYIANLSMARSNEVDIAGALQRLKEKKKSFDSSVMAAEQELAVCRTQISEQEARVERQDALAEELKMLLAERSQRKQEFAEQTKDFLGEQAAEVERMSDRFLSYRQMGQELEAIEKTERSLQERIQRISEEKADSAVLDADLKQLNHLQSESQAFEMSRNRELDKEEEQLEHEVREKRTGCMIAAAAGLVITIVTAILSVVPGIAVGVAAMLFSGLLYLKMAAGLEKKHQQLQEKKQEAVSEQLRLDGLRKEILVRNYVMDVEGLRKKYYARVAEEAELRQLKERLHENEQEQERRLEQRGRLEEELLAYCKRLHLEIDGVEQLTKEQMQQYTDRIRARQQREQEALEQQRSCEEELRSREEHIRWELSTLEGAAVCLEELKKEEKELQKAHAEYVTESSALDFAMDAIKELSAEIHDSFGESLNRSISEKVKEITDGAYDGITVDEQLAVKVVSKNGYLPLEKLSAGTNCQVYLAVRMAMAELFFEKEEMPLLFDDTFALYDDERTAAALSYLAGTGRQILIFTCHSREGQLLKQAGISHTLIKL